MNLDNSISKNLTITENGTVAIHRIKKSDNSRVHIKQSEVAKKMAEGFYDDKQNELLVIKKSEDISFSKDKPKKKKDKKGKKHKKAKKHKKKQLIARLEQTNLGSRADNVGMHLSKILAESIDVRVVKNSVYIYNKETGMFSLSDKQEISTKINALLTKSGIDLYKFTSRDSDEAYKMLLTDASIQREALESAYNQPYVLCRNGVLDLTKMELLPFSPKFEFTYGIRANYDKNAEGEFFKAFIDYATDGDKALKSLIQEVMGYALSNYSNVRTAFMFGTISGSGKSTILDVIRQLVGQSNVCEVPMNLMENEYYAATILSSKLNIVPDHNDKVIKDVAKFKSFVSDTDVISGRNPCEKPFSERCRTKMLFASNHHFRFSGVTKEDLEAFFDRMIYIPFDRKIKNRIDAFWEVLIPEYDYIFTWSMKGLKRLIENNFNFTECSASQKMKRDAMGQCSPEETFFDTCIKFVEDDRFESTVVITEAFKSYCSQNRIKGNFDIKKYIEEHYEPSIRKRIDENGFSVSSGNAIAVFKGIRLRNKYRI